MSQTFSWAYNSGPGTGPGSVIMSSTEGSMTVSGSSFNVTFPSCSVQCRIPDYPNNNRSYGLRPGISENGGTWGVTGDVVARTSVVSSTAYATFAAYTDSYSTSSFFNSNNKTSLTATLRFGFGNAAGYFAAYVSGVGWEYSCCPATNAVVFTETITLDAPPQISTTAVGGGTDDANGVRHRWKGISTANVNIYKTWAQYGGTINEGTLTVGEQSATVTDITSSYKNAKIPTLDTVGTFTPVITVTDSRGQVSTKTLPDITVEEYIEPTANWGTVQKDKTGYYANQTTVSLTVSDISVMTGYEATRVTFRVGTQVKTVDLEQGQDSATLSMLLTQTGTLSTRVGITTTANLTSWHYYDDIVAEEYVSPSVNFQANRAKNSGTHHGILDDEGEEILISATFDYLDSLDLLEPTTMITEQSEVTSSAVITWYESWDATTGVSDAVNWASYSPQSPITLYGLMTGYSSTTGFDTAYSYQTTITPRDEISSGTAISQTTANAYYTIDFQAGGREIAFGAPANDDVSNYPEGLFKCAMSFVNVGMVGEIKAYAGITVPNGWLECDGSEVLKADYPILYNAIADLWGTASDNYHFVLPNLTGRVPVGASTTDEWVTIIRENPASTFTLSTPTYCRIGTGSTWSDPALLPPGVYTASWSSLTTYFPVDPASGATKVIQVKMVPGTSAGEFEHVISTQEMPTHTHIQNAHNHSQNAHSHPVYYSTFEESGSGTVHQQLKSSGSYYSSGSTTATNIANTATNQNTGGSLSMSLMQPFAVVKYIICAI